MSSKQYQIIKELQSSVYNRKQIFNIYMWKYYNLFMGAYRIKGVEEEEQEFILRKFWAVGRIGAFIVKGTEQTQTDLELIQENKELASVNDYPNGMIAFTDFAPVIYNIYDWPIVVNLINTRGAKFIPTTPQNVNETCVIGYCQKNKMPVKTIVEYYVSKITDIEMTIRQQLKSHKVPWLIATTPENEKKLGMLFDRIENDEDALFLSASEVEAIKILNGGNAYIIDKLYQQKQAYENELLTYLGVDNLGTMQKKEHLQLDEANSNNELINDFGDCFLDCMKEFAGRVRDYLGYEIEFEAIARPVMAENEKANPDDSQEKGDKQDA